MVIPINIDDLINQRVVESNRIEFKSGFNPNTIIHSICAFANDIDNMGGGYIIIGIEEENGSPKFPIKGIEQNKIDGILKELVGYCHCIEPLYNPVVEPVIYQGKYIIIIWVTGGYGRPYKASKDVFNNKTNKYYYIRKFSSTLIASPNEEKELFYISSDTPFDDRPNLLAELEDLDIELLRKHLREINSDLYKYSLNKSLLEIATDMQLVSGPTERIKPLNVGILMFSEKIEKYFRYARIELVDIPDPTGNGMSEKTFKGPIQRQLTDALLYIKNYILKEITFKKSNKAEAVKFFNYPYAAIEEILSNAVYHRSYQVREPIQVRINQDSIEITSYPGFDRSISDEAIKKYNLRAKIYRNRRIGDFLKELKLIEGRNTGFPNALNALKLNASPMLKFEMDAERQYLSVIIPINEHFITKKQSKNTNYEAKIIEILREQNLSMTELSKELGYKGITQRLRNALENLLSTNKIVKIIDKSGKPKLSLPTTK